MKTTTFLIFCPKTRMPGAASSSVKRRTENAPAFPILSWGGAPTDPSLIIYAALRTFENKLIVTNGDQTDTVYEALREGGGFREALSTRAFEPDAPNFTPRISGMLTFTPGDFCYEMNILKSADEKGSACNRYTFDYAALPGVGHFLHTYVTDGQPLPTFLGEPERVKTLDDIDEHTEKLWNALSPDNRISLYVRYIDLATGQAEKRLVNRNR